MVKEKKEKFLQPKSLLTKEEYQQYQIAKKIPARGKLEEEMKERKKEVDKYIADKKYEGSRTGMFAKKLTGLLRAGTSAFSSKQGITKALYKRKVSQYTQEHTATRTKYKGRGRPKGSYDQRYAKFGGVYGYRKWLAQQRWKERLNLLERKQITPRQRAILDTIRAREEMQMRSPEAQIVPDTTGNIPLRGLMDEIDGYANIVP